MAVGFREGSGGGGPDVREYERGDCLFCEASEVDAVPGGSGGGEDTRFEGEGRGGVVAYAEAIAVVGSPVVETETAVVRLCED